MLTGKCLGKLIEKSGYLSYHSALRLFAVSFNHWMIVEEYNKRVTLWKRLLAFKEALLIFEIFRFKNFLFAFDCKYSYKLLEK